MNTHHDHAHHVQHTKQVQHTEHVQHTEQAQHGHHGEHHDHDGMVNTMARRAVVSAVLSLPLMVTSHLGMMLGLHVEPPFGLTPAWFGFLLSTPVVWYGGWPFIAAAWKAARAATLNMMTLIAVGILVSYLYSVATTLFIPGEVFYEAAAMLTTFSLLGHWMEMRSKSATGKAVEALLRLAPATAMVQRHGHDMEIAVDQIVVGDVVVIRPGDRIPVDGRVIDGSSYVDESMITGESAPVRKTLDSPVVTGTLNKDGAFRFAATAVGADTALAKIVQMVSDAQRSKAPAQRLADVAGRYLVIVALASGLITFLVWFVILDASAVMALTLAVSTVVIACPDALALATPTAITVGVGHAARQGILFKHAMALEATSNVDTVVFDKTGTLTTGMPTVTEIVTVEDRDAASVLALAAAADTQSQHPLARAIVAAAALRDLAVDAPEDFTSIPGKGVLAHVRQQRVLVGNAALMASEGIDTEVLAMRVEALANAAATPVYVAVDGRLHGVIGVADAIRDDARRAVDALHTMGVRVVMLSGDHRRTAEAVARHLGIDDVVADVLPHEKASAVRHLQQQGKRVAMVGDGVNDAPALAEANVGIAIGAGTDVAVETAGVVLVKSTPFDVVHAIEIARKVRRKITQNLYWATIYNLLAIPVAAGLLYPSFGIMLRPEWAAIAMSASTVTVTINAMLLRRTAYTARPSR